MKSLQNISWDIHSAGNGNLMTRILAARAISDTHEFLTNTYQHHGHDGFLFRDMEKAVDRIARAQKNNECVAIFGDYDADGICGAAILHETLLYLGITSEVFLPDRNTHGYGLQKEIIDEMKQKNCTILITCDCGISNIEEIAYANTQTIETIVTDHHQFKETLPAAFAILHPLVPHEDYPGKTLSGGGVALKFAESLCEKISGDKKFTESLHDLAAIAAVADMVPLQTESRLLTKVGIEHMRNNPRAGLQALFTTHNIEPHTINARTIGFDIAPRINAPGRITTPHLAFKLLTTHSPVAAAQLLQEIDVLNKERSSITSKAVVEARAQIEKEQQHHANVIFAYAPHWKVGILGLIANKLKDEYNCAALVMTKRGNHIVGSARSPKTINITAALNQVTQYLHAHGGHPQAAGFSIGDESLLSSFEEALREVVKSEIIAEKKLSIDTIAKFSELQYDLVPFIRQCEPFGMGNEELRATSQKVTIENIESLGARGTTLRFTLSQNGILKKAIGFQKSSWIPHLHIGDVVDIAYTISTNTFRGVTELQLSLEDIKR